MKNICKNLFFVTAATFAFSGLACRADESFSLDGPRLGGTVATPTADGLKVDFGNKDAWPNIAWRPASADGWNWSQYEALVLTISNPGPENLSFHVKISDHNDAGKKGSAQLSGMAAAGETGRFYVALEPRSLREKSGMRFLPPITGDYGTRLGTGVEPSHIDELQIFRATPKQPSTLIIKSIDLQGQAKTITLDNLIDQYGQYNRADWPGKVHSDADLLVQKTAEEADLKANPPSKNLSKWGGWMGGPRQKATGFFRTEQIDGKWWMIDPDGYRFLSVGIDVVRPEGGTTIQGREAMFAGLPQTGEPLAAFYSPGKRDYNFLRANMTRKYGTDVDGTFNSLAIQRLKSWGFNTIGNWTPEKLGRDNQFPYVVAVGTKGGFATVPGHRGGKMPDPFDPAFAVDVETQLAPKTALAKNDPACIGYFFDNELPWGMPSIDGEHFPLAYGALGLDASSPAKSAFIDLLMKRYDSLDALNAAWKTNFASWDDLKQPLKNLGGIKSDAQRQDFSAFLSAYADKYFAVVSSAIKRQDPNHLYLGCRFAFWFTPEAVQASAKYVDAISFNVYGWNRNTYTFAEKLGKPCIIGEFHFGATDRGMFSGNVNTKNQQDRADNYVDYVKNVLSEPAFIGTHWFQFYDEPTSGRGDGENFNIGFASITDTPYTELINGARTANAQIYGWHEGAKAVE